MKYQRLSKEQFEELHQEFINFLAAQTISAQEWKMLKKEKPEVAEQELDIFSDLIWEGVLKEAVYLEHISKHQLHLFHCNDVAMQLISVVAKNVDLTTTEGFNWLKDNLQDDRVELYTASKDYSEDKNVDKFQLIRQGAIITKGELYKAFAQFISK